MRYIDEAALSDITVGSTILGSGGGGDPYVGMLLAREVIRKHGPATLVDLDELPDDAVVAFVAGVGAPGVLVEKLPREQDSVLALRELECHLGVTITHAAPAEAGGLNAVVPFAVASAKVPVVDADGMGRAFPALEMVTPTLHGALAAPMALVDEHGNVVILKSPTNEWAERIVRAITVASGCHMVCAAYVMTGVQAKAWLVRGALSLAEKLGKELRAARASHTSPVDAIVKTQHGVLLFEGKITAVERRTDGGWTVGEAQIEGSGSFASREMVLHFQNENLAAIRDGEVVATTPDLIMALGAESGEPIPAEEIRYGYRVAVVGMPSNERWRTEAGLALAGPHRFGYDLDFKPVEGEKAACAR
jgi:hypothetical protein